MQLGHHLDDERALTRASVLHVSSRPRVREVTSLHSWLCCSQTFQAVGTTDAVTRERQAYTILLIWGVTLARGVRLEGI